MLIIRKYALFRTIFETPTIFKTGNCLMPGKRLTVNFNSSAFFCEFLKFAALLILTAQVILRGHFD